MRVVTLAETIPGERRVAATPETVPQLVKAGLEVAVQAGAGARALAADAADAAWGPGTT